MRQVHDSLKRIVQIRDQAKRHQELVVQRYENTLVSLRKDIDRIETQFSQNAQFIRERIDTDAWNSVWMGLSSGNDLARQLAEARQRFEDFRIQYEDAMRMLKKASLDYETVKTLRQGKLALRQKTAGRAAQQTVDDAVLLSWHRKRHGFEESVDE